MNLNSHFWISDHGMICCGSTVVFLTMAIYRHIASPHGNHGNSRILLILGVIVFFISINIRYDLFLGWGGFMRKGPIWSRSGRADCNNNAKDKGVCDVGGFYRKGSSQPQDYLFSSWRKKNQTLSVSSYVIPVWIVREWQMLQVQEIFSDDTFFRLEQHEVMTEEGKVIQSWMWTEVPDMVC